MGGLPVAGDHEVRPPRTIQLDSLPRGSHLVVGAQRAVKADGAAGSRGESLLEGQTRNQREVPVRVVEETVPQVDPERRIRHVLLGGGGIPVRISDGGGLGLADQIDAPQAFGHHLELQAVQVALPLHGLCRLVVFGHGNDRADGAAGRRRRWRRRLGDAPGQSGHSRQGGGHEQTRPSPPLQVTCRDMGSFGPTVHAEQLDPVARAFRRTRRGLTKRTGSRRGQGFEIDGGRLDLHGGSLEG